MSNAAHRFNNELRYRSGTHPNQTQLTPPYILESVREALGGSIELDPRTEPDNPTAAQAWFTVEDDGLNQPWLPSRIFVNPPYGKAREPWVDRCIDAGKKGRKVILLIPAHTDTRVFQKTMQTTSGVVFLKGRVKFGIPRDNGRQQAASHPSALIGWNVDMRPLRHLGVEMGLAA